MARRLSHRLLIAWATAVAAASVTTPAAGAAQFCVGATGTTCDAGTFAATASGLASAIGAAKAAGGADEIRIAEGTITGITPLVIDDAAGVSIAGAGADRTQLQFAVGLGQTAVTWASFRSSLADLRVSGSGAFTTTGLRVDAPGSGLFDSGPAMTRLQVDGFATGIAVTRSAYSFLFLLGSARRLGGFSLTDSVIDVGAIATARAVTARGPSGAGSLARVTISGRSNTQFGVDVASNPGEYASLTVSDAIIETSGSNSRGLACLDGAGTAELTVTGSAFSLPVSYVDTDLSDADCGAAPSSLLNPASSSLGFLDRFGGDFRLAHYSVLIDRGAATASADAIDAHRGARLVDGDGDGTTAVDLGAHEYQRRTPAPPTITLPTTTIPPGTALQFSASGSDPDPGDFAAVSWDFGDGTTSSSNVPVHAYAALGTYTATATATDPTGLTSSAQVQIRVENPPPVGLPTVAPTPTPPDPFFTTTGPRVRVLSPPTQAVRRSGAGFTTPGTTAPDVASLETAGAVTLRVSLTRLVPGRRSGSRCRAGASRGRRCTARVPVRAIAQIPVSPGPVQLRFGGKLGGRRLAKGTYDVTVTPVGIDRRKGRPATYPLVLR